MGKKLLPQIRFKGFDDEWEKTELGSFAQKIKRVVPSSSAPVMMISAQDGFIKQSERYSFDNAGQSLSRYIELHKNELAYNHGASKIRPYGSCYALRNPKARIPYVYHCFSIKENLPSFVSLTLNTESIQKQLRKLVTSGARMDGLLNISFEQYCSIDLTMPAIKEQIKLNDYFARLDVCANSIKRKIEHLKNLKATMLVKMFPQGDSLVPEIRFKGFGGDWKVTSLGNLANRITRKNVSNQSNLPLTISAQYGLIPQLDFFSNRIASRDVSNYYLIKKGEFAYNKSSSDGYPYGAVKRLENYEMGVLSTLYIVFAINDIIDSDYLTSFYDTCIWHKDVSMVAAEGARNHGLLNIAASDFFKTNVVFPTDILEQKMIGKFFNSLDIQLHLYEKKLEQIKNLKSTFLQKMFV